jgi:ATP phosphoribosyltransferase
MEQCAEALRNAGIIVRKTGPDRGYRGEIGPPASKSLCPPRRSRLSPRWRMYHREDLIRRHGRCRRRSLRAPLGFGLADVVVGAGLWLDVRRMADLEQMSVTFRRLHGRRVRVATKYMNLTRRTFLQMGVTGYRIVESLGATEGTRRRLAELIVDITTTGETLRANGLRVLEDGVILKSRASLVRALAPCRSDVAAAAEAEIMRRLNGRAG